MILAGRVKECSEVRGLWLHPVQVGLGRVALDFEDTDFLFGSDDSVSAGAAMSDMLNRAADSATKRPLGTVSRRAGQEALKDGFTVDRA